MWKRVFSSIRVQRLSVHVCVCREPVHDLMDWERRKNHSNGRQFTAEDYSLVMCSLLSFESLNCRFWVDLQATTGGILEWKFPRCEKPIVFSLVQGRCNRNITKCLTLYNSVMVSRHSQMRCGCVLAVEFNEVLVTYLRPGRRSFLMWILNFYLSVCQRNVSSRVKRLTGLLQFRTVYLLFTCQFEHCKWVSQTWEKDSKSCKSPT